MEMSKYLAVLVYVVVLYSVQATAQGGGDGGVLACMQKLMPCQPYLHTVNPPPPPSCCGPLKEIVEKNAPCLCTVFNNPEMLQKLNLTKEDALELPKACGVNPDVSLCPKTASSSPPPASPVPTTGGSSVQAVSFIGLGFVTAFVATILY